MPGPKDRRDNALIDAIEEISPTEFNGKVWRIVREGRDPLQCSSSGGRWDDGSFDVLYTSQERLGAVEEMRFHLMRGQPIFPSKVKYSLFELEVSLERSLKLIDLQALNDLGLDVSKYGRLSYEQKSDEYPKTQEIAEAARFLDFDGIIVPSARYSCHNVIIFCDKVSPDSMSVVRNHGLVDWDNT